jgi:Protein of unknown function
LWTKIVVAALAGALGSAMANRGVAVFHDGLRSLLPELAEGRMQRKEFTSIAWGMSFGLVLGFGVPFSLLTGILLYHGLWLGTDVIGTWFPGAGKENSGSDRKSHWSLVGAIVAGAVYGGALVLALEGLAYLFAQLPIRILDSMEQFASPIVLTFPAFPAVAVAYQHGAKQGAIAFLIALLGRLAAAALGLAQPDLWMLAVGMVVMVLYALREKRSGEAERAMAALSPQRASRLRGYLPAIAVLGAVYGLACNQAVLMEGPQSLLALAQGNRAAAASFAIARALSFTPLKVMSALATGVFAMDGLGFVAAAGLVSTNVVMAALSGAIVMSVEALSLAAVARFLTRFPGIWKAADHIRTAMTRVLEVGSLVGGMMAAQHLAPGFGFVVVAGLYLLNEIAGTPLVRVAAGPVAVILVGIVANALAMIPG